MWSAQNNISLLGHWGLFGRGNNKVLRQRVGGLIKRYSCDIKTPGNAIPTPFHALCMSFVKLLTPYSGTPSLLLGSQVGTLIHPTNPSGFRMLMCGGRHGCASLSDPGTWCFLSHGLNADSYTKVRVNLSLSKGHIWSCLKDPGRWQVIWVNMQQQIKSVWKHREDWGETAQPGKSLPWKHDNLSLVLRTGYQFLKAGHSVIQCLEGRSLGLAIQPA